MKTRYIDLIEQTFDFPQEEFEVSGSQLSFHNIDLMNLVQAYGTPLKFTYLPQISNNITKVKLWFSDAMEKHNYQGIYHYCYCTKSAHFKFILDEVLNNNIHIEISSAIDIDIVESLKNSGKINNQTFVLCNGFKREQYISNIGRLINNGHKNCIPIVDNYEELNLLSTAISDKFKREVNRAHRRFFEKRGMDPDNLPKHLRSWTIGDRMSSSSPKMSDPPRARHLQASSLPSGNEKQKSA